MKKLLICLLLLGMLCLTACTSVVDKQTSPDGNDMVILHSERGLNPSNRMDGWIELQHQGRTVASAEESFWYGPINEVDLRINKDSWDVVWEEDKVVITLYGLYDPQNGVRVIEWALE